MITVKKKRGISHLEALISIRNEKVSKVPSGIYEFEYDSDVPAGVRLAVLAALLQEEGRHQQSELRQ